MPSVEAEMSSSAGMSPGLCDSTSAWRSPTAPRSPSNQMPSYGSVPLGHTVPGSPSTILAAGDALNATMTHFDRSVTSLIPPSQGEPIGLIEGTTRHPVTFSSGTLHQCAALPVSVRRRALPVSDAPNEMSLKAAAIAGG